MSKNLLQKSLTHIKKTDHVNDSNRSPYYLFIFILFTTSFRLSCAGTAFRPDASVEGRWSTVQLWSDDSNATRSSRGGRVRMSVKTTPRIFR